MVVFNVRGDGEITEGLGNLANLIPGVKECLRNKRIEVRARALADNIARLLE